MTEQEKIHLAGMLPEEICSKFEISPSFRGIQIFKWISQGVNSFEEMLNLPKDLRIKLNNKSLIKSSKISQVLRDTDGTIKLQITLFDNRCIEAVLLTDKSQRKTACVSCQAGCGMNCAFCQTGKLGFGRNLTASEIVEQFLFLEEIAGNLDNIVFMGMGEPMLNLNEIRKAVEILTHPEGKALSTRRITLSTCGIIKGIYDLADNGPQLRLAVSLTTANPELREKLMPVTKTNPLSQLKEAISYYTKKTGKRCTLEAALMAGTNDTTDSALEMVNFAKGLDVHINLIPWNSIPNIPFSTPTASECKKFVSILEKEGINVTLRTHRGRKIGGACGQLGKITLE